MTTDQTICKGVGILYFVCLQIISLSMILSMKKKFPSCQHGKPVCYRTFWSRTSALGVFQNQKDSPEGPEIKSSTFWIFHIC